MTYNIAQLDEKKINSMGTKSLCAILLIAKNQLTEEQITLIKLKIIKNVQKK